MEKIDISKSVKSIDFGKQYGVRVQGYFRQMGYSQSETFADKANKSWCISDILVKEVSQ